MQSFETADALLAGMIECRSIFGCERNMSVLEHGLTCAEVLRRLAPDDLALQVAGLIHDVGYLFTGATSANHPELGSRAVVGLMPERIVEMIRLHSEAKRYLVQTDADYLAQLSEGSQVSLRMQGGAMTAHQASSFLEEPFMRDAIRLRMADEAAKDPALPRRNINEIFGLVLEVAKVGQSVGGLNGAGSG